MSDAILNHVDEHEARVIAQAPVLVFLLVSAADGTIDKREIKGVESLLSSEPYSDLFAVMVRARLSINDTLRQLTENPVDYLQELKRIDRVLDNRLPSALSLKLKQQLYDLGHHVALSSGRFLGLVGDPVSKQELTALKVIAGLFGIAETQQ
ncbi:MAG: hypothetical protein P8103_17700 [Candidatus Thiodiazotropha sp.]